MKKYISVNRKVRSELMTKYGMSRRGIWMALSFLTHNDKGKEIRKDAIDMGGRYIEEDFTPRCSIKFDEHGGFTQTFACGVRVKQRDGKITIEIPGRANEEYDDVRLSEWGNILSRAQEISDSLLISSEI